MSAAPLDVARAVTLLDHAIIEHEPDVRDDRIAETARLVRRLQRRLAETLVEAYRVASLIEETESELEAMGGKL